VPGNYLIKAVVIDCRSNDLVFLIPLDTKNQLLRRNKGCLIRSVKQAVPTESGFYSLLQIPHLWDL